MAGQPERHVSDRGLALAEGVQGIVHRELPLELLVIVGSEDREPAGNRLEPSPSGIL